MSFKADVLVIMPHPDDAEFGAGGTIAKMTAEGKKWLMWYVPMGIKALLTAI